MSEWIPCSERLPEDGEWLTTIEVISAKATQRGVAIVTRRHGEWEQVAVTGVVMRVLAWRPLPEPWEG